MILRYTIHINSIKPMQKYKIITLVAGLLLLGNVAYAQTPDVASLQRIIDQLRAQIAAMQQAQGQTSMAALRTQLQLSRNLGIGQTGDDVTLLQQTLATDPSLFSAAPTGYYGPLTAKAVKALQERFGLDQTGAIGPLTRGELNKLFEDVSSTTIALPPGLLRGGFAPLHVDIESIGTFEGKGDASIFPVDASSSRILVHFASKDDLNASTTNSIYTTHIHAGTCASSGPISIPLNNIVHNGSDTIITRTLTDLVNMYPLSIMVHKDGVIIACGDLGMPRPIYRKMDVNGDGRIDNTDRARIMQMDRIHQEDMMQNASTTEDNQQGNRPDMKDMQEKFNKMRNRLMHGVQGLIPGRGSEQGDN